MGGSALNWGTPLGFGLVAAVLGLVTFLWWHHWALFAFGFMTCASAAASGGLVWGLHLWLRHLNKCVPDGAPRLWLCSTAKFDPIRSITGLVERFAFTSVTILALAKGSPAAAHRLPMDERAVQTIVIAAGGWIVLKTLVAWRRIPDAHPIINTLSNVGVVGGLFSVGLGILGGVLALVIEF